MRIAVLLIGVLLASVESSPVQAPLFSLHPVRPYLLARGAAPCYLPTSTGIATLTC